MQIKNDLVYKVTREGATEPPFSGEYNNNKKKGKYLCVHCETILFSSEKKYDSGIRLAIFFMM